MSACRSESRASGRQRMDGGLPGDLPGARDDRSRCDTQVSSLGGLSSPLIPRWLGGWVVDSQNLNKNKRHQKPKQVSHLKHATERERERDKQTQAASKRIIRPIASFHLCLCEYTLLSCSDACLQTCLSIYMSVRLSVCLIVRKPRYGVVLPACVRGHVCLAISPMSLLLKEEWIDGGGGALL